MKRLKVIEYIPSLYDGGAETLVKTYASLIDRERFDITIVVNRGVKHSANTQCIREMDVPIISIYPCWNILVRVFNKALGKYYVPHVLKRIMQKEKVDILHVHLALLRYVERISHELKGVKLFYTCHSLPSLFFSGKRKKEGEAARYLLKNNNLQLIALHDDMATEINEMFGIDNTIVIRNGIDFSRFNNSNTTIEEREKLGITKDAFVIGHVGRFVESKNHSFLIEVFREVQARNNNAFLLLVGTGDSSHIEQKLFEYGLSDKYIILSNRKDVNEIMHAMDVFVFPSKFEGLGIVLIEAQATGLRCIVSDAVPKEALKTEECISLPLDDPGGWADVILDNSLKGKWHGSLEDYDMNKEIIRLEKLYLGGLDE